MTSNKRGRKPMEKTPEQVAAQKEKWFGAARNARRRERYEQDPDYRAKHRAKSLDYLREQHGISTDFRDCRANIDILDAIGDVRTVKWDGGEYLTLTTEELAKALGEYSVTNVRRWITNGQLPEPVVPCDVQTDTFGRKGETTEMFVYLEDEIKALMEVLGPHQTDYHYYRKSHRATIEKVFEAVNAVRAEYGIAINREGLETA